jgi:beta-lactamase regulating signal transducer with metallopeptidase domain
MMLETVLKQPFVQALGWALLHSIWQGALVALITVCALRLMRGFSAHARYVAATVSLSLMLAAPLLTFSRLYNSMRDDARAASHTANRSGEEQALKADESRVKRSALSQSDAAARALRPADFAPFEGFSENGFAPVARWLALLWLFGIALSSARLFRGWMTTERLKRHGRGSVSLACEESFARMARRLRVNRSVRLYKSVLVEVPTVIGWLRPVVLVPVSAFVGLSQPQLEALLAHELAHVRRYDYFVNLLQAVAETLLFYHPAAWWVSARIRAEREHACDDLAVEACGCALTYARALAELESMRAGDEPRLALAATGSGSLIGRIRRLVSAPSRSAERRPAWLAALVLFLTASSALFAAQGALDRATDTKLKAEALSPKRAVAVTFVGLPLHRGVGEDVATVDEANTKLLAGLSRYNVKAVGFVGEGMLYKEGETEARINILRKWLDAGHELGNQTYKHMNLYNTPLDVYEQNVIRGEQVTRTLLQERGQRLKYFSYPFLNTGPNLEIKRAFEQFLKERGYTIHAVTIDNMDWIFSNAYQEASRRKDSEVMKRISDEYVAYMESVFAHYEQLSLKVFGREIPQVLMLSASAQSATRSAGRACEMKAA